MAFVDAVLEADKKAPLKQRQTAQLDQNMFDAVKKLEALRQMSISDGTASETVQPTNQEMKPLDHTKSQ